MATGPLSSSSFNVRINFLINNDDNNGDGNGGGGGTIRSQILIKKQEWGQ